MTEDRQSAMEDRIFIKEVVLHRNIETGDMELKNVSTNKGTFDVHGDIIEAFDKDAMDSFYHYIRSLVVPFIKKFLEEEKQEKGDFLE